MHLKSSRPLWPSTRRSLLTGVILAAVVFAALRGNAWADVYWADSYPTPIGGPGGGQFIARCPAGQLLVGVELRTGDDVDAIAPICAAAYGPQRVAWLRPYPSTLAGANRQVACTDNAPHGVTLTPVVVGLSIGSEGRTEIVNSIDLHCSVGPDTDPPSRRFEGLPFAELRGFDGPANDYNRHYGSQDCPMGAVAVGIYGRAGIWLDAVGLICGAETLTPEPPPSQGTGAWPSPPEPPKVLAKVHPTPRPAGWTLCDAAREARSRNSPKAPDLEAQCLATKLAATTRLKSVGTAAVLASPSLAHTSATMTPPPALTTPPPASPPPIAADPHPVPAVAFNPPLLQDDAQLWACVDAAAYAANAGACSGEESAEAYCRLRNADRGPVLLIAHAQLGIPVRSVNGDTCPDAVACRVVSELQCDH